MERNNLGNMPICARCRFWQMEPGALNKSQTEIVGSITEIADLKLTRDAESMLSTYGKCMATYTRHLLTLKGISRTTQKGSLYGIGTSGLANCESRDNGGRILFDEAEVG